MKRRISKRIIAIGVSLCVAFSIMPLPVSAEAEKETGTSSAQSKENPWVSTGRTFSINRVYSAGLTACGSALVRIAGATDNEGFQKVASFVNKWVCGGSNTGQTLAEIQTLCNEILNEVKLIDEHLRMYDAEILGTLQEIQYTEAKNELDQQWFKDVEIYETAGNVGNTLKSYKDYMETAQLYTDGKTDMNAVEKSKQALYRNFCEVYKAAGNNFGDKNDEEIKDTIFCDDTIDGVFNRSIQNMINALNKPSDEKNYADAAAQFAYMAYGFSGDQYNYIVSSIDKQFMEIIAMEMMYQEFIAQRGDYFEEKYKDDERKWDRYAAWTDNLNVLNEDVAKAMDTMLDREILVSDSTVSSIRMKLNEFVKPEDMVSVRMKNENYHEKLTGEFYKKEQPVIDAFDERIYEADYWESNADVITPFVNFHRIAVPTPKTEKNPSGIDIYYIFDTSQPHNAEEDGDWNSDDSVPENLRFYQFEEKLDHKGLADEHIPSCDFINLTKENYSDGQNQFSCVKNTEEFQSLFVTGVFLASSSIPANYLSEYLVTKENTKTYIALPDYDYDWTGHLLDAYVTSYTIFHVVDTTVQCPGSSFERSTLSAEKIQPDKSEGTYSAYTVILKNRPQKDGYYKTKVDVATNGVGDTELEMVLEDGTTCQENIVPSGKEVTLRFKAEGTTVLESFTLQRHNNTENPSEVTSEETLLTKDQIATLIPDEEGYYTYTCAVPYSNATFVLNGVVGHKVYVKALNQSLEDAILLDSYVDYFEEGENVEFYVSDNVKSVGYYEGNTYKEIALTENYEGDRKGSFVMPAKDITLYYNAICKEHSYDNGFCTKCGEYQQADYNESTGSYEIGNGGQMFWFAALVNGDGEHALIQEAKPDAHGVLVSDISLKNPSDEKHEWKSIGEFTGIFDGQNHTISDFVMTKVNAESIGFFQFLRNDPNETEKATLKNFTLNGTIVTTASFERSASAAGGVVGTASGGVIRRVNSNVNIAKGVIYYIGGIAGLISEATSIEESTYSGKIVLDFDSYGVGGIAGAVYDDAKIKDCANYGSIINYKHDEGYYGNTGCRGGITGYVSTGGKDFILSDCYNYSRVLIKAGDNYGAISGYCEAKKDGIKNNYYLDTLQGKGFGGKTEIANDEELAKEKTAEQFKSGEEAYLLNNEVTDGSQVWYQNIDNGETPDAYPVLDDTHGTVYRWEDGTYSNYEKEPVEETYEIRTFKEFKEIPEIVKKNNRANFKLTNTIFGNGETMIECIGSADNPYNGTFDGQGYYVYRFDIKSADGNAALFDTIGAQGSVKNFGAFYQNIEGEKAAGLAIVNYGLIDECISGSNLSGSFSDRLTDEHKDLSETTTFVKGTSMAGGVVVENKGMIRNTANYANATASASDGIVGGIAVVNSGTIENCMSIGALSTKENGIAGGIVGKLDKNGSIQIAYSAQTAIEGGTIGAVFGTKEETAGAVNNTYYLDTLSGNEEQGTAKTAAEMKSNAFKEELNTLVAGNEELCSWTWNSTKNQGYPRILSSLITEVELVNASRGLTVKGMMHKDTKLQLNELDKKNDIYQAFKKYAQKTDKQVLYSAEPMLVYADGQPAPYEGNLNVKLDLSKY
ncbi:MAG: hypothetical protein EGR70_04250 [[Ruminococcus] faecis]|nr:hypothetical protein [Mediterraneibacter faecis]